MFLTRTLAGLELPSKVPSKKTKEAVMLWMQWNLKVEEVEENVGEEGNNEWSLRINLRSGSCSQPSSLVH